MIPPRQALILVAGLALWLPASAIEPVRIDAIEPGRPEAGLSLVLGFAQPPVHRLRHQGERIVLEFENVELPELQAMLDGADLDRHAMVQRWGAVQPAGQRPALVLELAMAVTPTVSLAATVHGHHLRLELPVAADARPPASPDSSLAEIRDVRFGQREGGLRLVIETDRAVPFQRLDQGPTRQVRVRLLGLAPAELEAALHNRLPTSQNLVKALVVNGGQSGEALLQLDLRTAAAVTLFNLQRDAEFGHRLVLDLEPVALERAPEPTKPSTRPERTPPRLAEVAPEPESSELLWLEATLNQQRQHATVLALKDRGDLLLARGELAQWQLKTPPQADLIEYGEEWFSLAALGIDYHFDARRLTLDMTAPASLFAGHAMHAPGRAGITPTPSPLGAFLNYDLSLTHSGGNATGGALFELGAFNGWGSGTSSALARHGSRAPGQQLVRLDTTWRRDFPARRRTLILGDTLSRATGWSGGVRYGGLQWGNNFDLQPELITLPLLSMAGEASLPSVIEVYINDALRLRQDVAPGPFDIDQIPVVTGPGQATLVVTDMLGRQQILTRDFYASQRLLRAGLHDWTWDLGAIRENYGLGSFDYGRGFLAATHRYGLSNRLTGEFHGHLTERHGVAGVGASALIPGGGVLTAASAISRGDEANGWLHSLGLQRQGQRISAGFDSQFASRGFTRLGQNRPLPERQLRAHLGLRAFERGRFSLSYTGQDFHDREAIEFLTLRYSQRLEWAGHLSISALHYLDTGDHALTASLSIPLGAPRTSLSMSASWREDAGFGTFNLRRTPPVGTGLGYHLQARVGDGEFQRAGLSYQNDHGAWQAELSHRDGQLTGRTQASGGLAWLDGGWFKSRRLHSSFAVVHVPGLKGVQVYAENQSVARTNARGHALVPSLRPYQRNRLRIEQADLPLGTRIDGLEQEVAPYYRSGILVAFPIQRTRDAFFRVQLETGEPLPLGAAIFDRHGEVWPVGHRGETFITGLDAENRLQARHNGRGCEIELAVPDSDEALLDLGTVTCREVTR